MIVAIFNKNGLFWGELSGGERLDFFGVSIVAIDWGRYIKPLRVNGSAVALFRYDLWTIWSCGGFRSTHPTFDYI